MEQRNEIAINSDGRRTDNHFLEHCVKCEKTFLKKKIAAKRHLPPKLCNLPPTMAVFEQHCARAHLQVSIRKAASSSAFPNIQ